MDIKGLTGQIGDIRIIPADDGPAADIRMAGEYGSLSGSSRPAYAAIHRQAQGLARSAYFLTIGFFSPFMKSMIFVIRNFLELFAAIEKSDRMVFRTNLRVLGSIS